MNAITYKDVFPYIRDERVHLGINSGSMEFRVPDYFDKGNVYVKDGTKYAKFGNICWYTNFCLEQFAIIGTDEAEGEGFSNGLFIEGSSIRQCA